VCHVEKLDTKTLSDIVRESVKKALSELMPAETKVVDEGAVEDFTYTPPKTIAFRAFSMDLLSSDINDWVETTGSDICSISLMPFRDDEDDEGVEAIVVFYGEDEDFEPPLGWLNSGFTHD